MPATPALPLACAGFERGWLANGDWKMLEWWLPPLLPLSPGCPGKSCVKFGDSPFGEMALPGRPPPLLLLLGPGPPDVVGPPSEPAAFPAPGDCAAAGCACACAFVCGCGCGGGIDGCPGSRFCERSASSTAFAHSLRESAFWLAPACDREAPASNNEDFLEISMHSLPYRKYKLYIMRINARMR
jgi:hypothetical protein